VRTCAMPLNRRKMCLDPRSRARPAAPCPFLHKPAMHLLAGVSSGSGLPALPTMDRTGREQRPTSRHQQRNQDEDLTSEEVVRRSRRSTDADHGRLGCASLGLGMRRIPLQHPDAEGQWLGSALTDDFKTCCVTPHPDAAT
jgi:hypothetical protein